MAGDYIQWVKGLARRREVVLMAARLGKTRKEVAASLMELWEWCDENIPDQHIDPKTKDASITLGADAAAFLDSIAGLPGLAEAMASPEVGWLVHRSEGRCVFPKLGRHNGQTAKTRATTAKRVSRWRSRNGPVTDGDVTPSSLSMHSESGFGSGDGGAGEGVRPEACPPVPTPPAGIVGDALAIRRWQANELFKLWNSTSKAASPWGLTEALPFFEEKLRAGVAFEAVWKAIWERPDRTLSHREFWVRSGLKDPLPKSGPAKPKRTEAEEHAAIKAALEAEEAKRGPPTKAAAGLLNKGV